MSYLLDFATTYASHLSRSVKNPNVVTTPNISVNVPCTGMIVTSTIKIITERPIFEIVDYVCMEIWVKSLLVSRSTIYTGDLWMFNQICKDQAIKVTKCDKTTMLMFLLPIFRNLYGTSDGYPIDHRVDFYISLKDNEQDQNIDVTSSIRLNSNLITQQEEYSVELIK